MAQPEIPKMSASCILKFTLLGVLCSPRASFRPHSARRAGFRLSHTWSAPRKFWRASRSDLQILRASRIITGLLAQRIAICCLRYGVQIFMVEELHGKACENRAAEGETRDSHTWHGRR
jgi:hypothetical protein